MTYTDRFPTRAIVEYVESKGGIAAVLEQRNFDDDRYIVAASRYSKAIIDNPETLSVAVADGLAIDLLGLHPGLIWAEWFDQADNALDYDTIETELLLGRFDSRAQFWQYVSDLQSEEVGRNDQTRIMAALVPEARRYFETLPPELYTEAQLRRGLQVGETCKQGHLIRTQADLINRGATGMGCRACQRPRLAVGMKCRNDHKIETEDDLERTGTTVTCKECRRERNRRSKAKKRKGRTAKLTPEAAETIRERLAAGEKQAALAKEYGVSQVAVSKIKRGVIYNEEAA